MNLNRRGVDGGRSCSCIVQDGTCQWECSTWTFEHRPGVSASIPSVETHRTLMSFQRSGLVLPVNGRTNWFKILENRSDTFCASHMQSDRATFLVVDLYLFHDVPRASIFSIQYQLGCITTCSTFCIDISHLDPMFASSYLLRVQLLSMFYTFFAFFTIIAKRICHVVTAAWRPLAVGVGYGSCLPSIVSCFLRSVIFFDWTTTHSLIYRLCDTSGKSDSHTHQGYHHRVDIHPNDWIAVDTSHKTWLTLTRVGMKLIDPLSMHSVSQLSQTLIPT